MKIASKQIKKYRAKNIFGEGLSKIQIIELQINRAINMLFDNENPVLIHTMISPAFQICRDLARKQQTKTYLAFKDNIKEGFLNEFWKHVNRAWTFFKHADSDPESFFPGMDEQLNDYAIIVSILIYNEIAGSISKEMQAYSYWFMSLNPEFLKECALKDLIEANFETTFTSISREDALFTGKQLLLKKLIP